MKFFAVFAVLIAASSANKIWTLKDLSLAIDNKHTDPILNEYLIKALDEMMLNLYNGNQVEQVTVSIPPSSGVSLSLHQLSTIVQNPNVDYALQPLLTEAINHIMEDLFAGGHESVATVVMPGLDIHHFSLRELSDAIEHPSTSSEHLPYLLNALDKFMNVLFADEHMEMIVVALPAISAEVNPLPASSPLVQLIVNVKQ